ncbi:DUF4974 domain-containing protein [Echinicola soli]|uniref:DUF4974 domain-containing protein n=1 Tax=Echinicola soli TaxID=2591634 RepID=A0A514CMS0_9BACT|nr:FecR domain-containing protein [Echinicola soli]QDH81101.1 DUF4974 domain-containing protein [Echinicola soli]
MNEQEYIHIYSQLILKSFKGTLSAVERDRLERWLSHSQENRAFYDRITQEQLLEEEMAFFSSIDSTGAFGKLKQHLPSSTKTENPGKKRWGRYAAVAAILAVLIFGWGIYGGWLPDMKPANQRTLASAEIGPGTDKAILVLPDGEEIMLDRAAEGTLKQDVGLTVAKRLNQVVFNVQKDFAVSDADMNRIFVPKGGKYQVVLADGTKVWLNSSSSLEFPSNFTGQSRMVTLRGEGYFEVAHNPEVPFIVQANDTEIKVLGTHFNINTYDNEPLTRTTLLEGSVKVSLGEHSKVISPGEQVLSDSGLPVKKIDMQQVVAWKDGLFMFKRTRLDDILRQLERWYAIKVSFDGEIPEKHFSGTISMDTNLSKVLGMLEMSGAIDFELNNGTVYVKNITH